MLVVAIAPPFWNELIVRFEESSMADIELNELSVCCVPTILDIFDTPTVFSASAKLNTLDTDSIATSVLKSPTLYSSPETV